MLMRMLEEQEEQWEEEDLVEQAAGLLGLMRIGAEEARKLHAEQRLAHRMYLTRPDLLPNPQVDTPWQVLYNRKNDRAFITTMGLNVASFELILSRGFSDHWNHTPITRHNISQLAKLISLFRLRE